MLPGMFVMDGLAKATNTSLGIVAALVLVADARALPILLVPALIILAGYRAHVSERRRHERLELLSETTSVLARSRGVAEAIGGLLARSLEAIRSEIAEVILFDADGAPLRTTHGPGPQRVTKQPADPRIAQQLAALLNADSPAVSLTPPFPNDVLRAHFEQRGIRHAIVALLPGEQRPLGTIMLANRFGLERGYAPDDLRWLEALSNTASLAIRARSHP